MTDVSLAQQPMDETALPTDVVSRRDVVYAERANGPVKLDLHTPPGDGPFPVVIWVHGGAWKMGDKAAWSHMNFLVGEGYAVANVGYRFTQVAPFPAQLDDVTAALDFLVKHTKDFRLDPARVAVSGESAGGHLAAMLGLTRPPVAANVPARVRCVIDLFGPTDLVELSRRNADANATVTALLGVDPAKRPDQAAAASPLSHVKAGAPPMLILHGTADPLVALSHSQRLADALKAADVSVTLVPLNGAGHAGPAFWTAEQRERMQTFLAGHLK